MDATDETRSTQRERPGGGGMASIIHEPTTRTTDYGSIKDIHKGKHGIDKLVRSVSFDRHCYKLLFSNKFPDTMSGFLGAPAEQETCGRRHGHRVF